MPRSRGHGVDVAVVVEEAVPLPAVPVAALLVVPEVLAVVVGVVVGGGAAGAGVTLGVANGTDRETYGSSTTFVGCTMPWFAAAATMRGGVSSSETASSA